MAPAAPNAMAIALPIPLDDPVTSAVFPFSYVMERIIALFPVLNDMLIGIILVMQSFNFGHKTGELHGRKGDIHLWVWSGG